MLWLSNLNSVTDVNNKLYFPQNWTCHPKTQFVLFSILRDFNFSDFKGKRSQRGFPATLAKGLTSGKCSDGWIVSFGLQRQPRAWDHPVISERKGSVQVSPKVKSAIPKLGFRTGLVNIRKVILGQ